ncbi:hypothetical protein AB1Y20_008306 [Prymnesium parvum]|uniref:COMM domain-containing protein 3 n=1 Tax=Prymnesium parvum TaxID=97485 RepID=A0AB34IXK2_PRYPA
MLAALAACALATLQEAFAALAACEGEAAQAQLAARLASLRSEDAVRALPAALALLEQKALLALQDALALPGTALRLVGLARRPRLDGCDATLLVCASDGGFRCAVEASCAASPSAPRDLFAVRLHALRPREGCAPPPREPCARTPREPLDAPLTAEKLGQTIARAHRAHAELLSRDASMAAAARELGDSALADLPYSALSFLLIAIKNLSCAALDARDWAGAELAVGTALDLEAQARPRGLDVEETMVAVRSVVSELFLVRAALKRGQGDGEGARHAARHAARLNLTVEVSDRKLRLATTRQQRAAPRDVAGLAAEEVVRLQARYGGGGRGGRGGQGLFCSKEEPRSGFD